VTQAKTKTKRQRKRDARLAQERSMASRTLGFVKPGVRELIFPIRGLIRVYGVTRFPISLSPEEWRMLIKLRFHILEKATDLEVALERSRAERAARARQEDPEDLTFDPSGLT
jgi:hypothetical protein